MSEKVPFMVDGSSKPKLNIAKLGEAGIGAGLAAALVWQMFQSNFEHTTDLQKEYIGLLQQHHQTFISAQKDYYKQVNADMSKVVQGLGDVVQLVRDIQEDQRSWVVGQMQRVTSQQ
jgi:hypothetical protein